jgi:ABC-type proline/glycine betaine transport system permease subunit
MMIIRRKNLSLTAIIIAAILAIPLIAMQFSPEVNWSPFDFAVMGVLLTITGLAVNLIISNVTGWGKRLLMVGAALFIFLLIWAELAVGIFGSPFAGS